MHNRLSIDSSNATTELCRLGRHYQTDKSPYNTGRFRHPYTAVYDLLFSALRYQAVVLGEIGILDNRSMLCWREFLRNAELHGWDVREDYIAKARAAGLHATHYDLMDVKNGTDIAAKLGAVQGGFDILIDDSTHIFEDQIRIASLAWRFMKPGGIMVIEDINRSTAGFEEQRYFAALSGIEPYFSNITFVDCRHELMKNPDWNPGYDNDKLLVLFRNDRAPGR